MAASDPIPGALGEPAARAPARIGDELAQAMRAWRRDFHRYPELGHQEHRTAARVAELLRSWGIAVHEGYGGTTGVIGVLDGRLGAGPTLGLRADMDALPMPDAGAHDHRSVHDGVAHACGHDGHTAILLGAACHLAANPDFAGRVVFIFQPAEEPLTGARALVDAGLFRDFPCDEVYGLHNNNCIGPGQAGVRTGAILSACDLFEIHIRGVGGHAAMPHQANDPIVAGAALVQSLQSVVSRNVSPFDTAVLSVCQFQAGSAINVIADHAVLRGTVRTLSREAQARVLERLRGLCEGTACGYGCEVEFRHLLSSPPTVNQAGPVEHVKRAAAAVLGTGQVVDPVTPLMASEDFAYLLDHRPGAYFFLGHDGLTCHHPEFDFDDALLAQGAAIFATLVYQRLAG
ncbi:M20 aminoacylase family protein [Castellaniella defragrans]|uniref:M20 aminoacylase family protein n=1 Tax=Castellaniella defragrans TaxID=75697 RepID=UPI002AFDDF19|nr:M20 aminoacylase family protein [Castellaniella defragrans]